ncbi:glycerol acyltransferase [filamentous cyanobacterium CCP1]|nr:glycerol acyltransferase [filamentous cyanobacterium CCP2]PSB68412.1 glycerol acyltransferase [filamentous cyanobacterium CCP1]
MLHSITQAQPPLEFIPPAFNPLVYQVTTRVLPVWMRWRLELRDIHVDNSETLVKLYQQFQAGKVRFMLAFRHPSTTDPYCMYYLLSHYLPKAAKQQGILLKPPTHAHFMYDRGIPLWAGNYMGWLFSRLGGTPIRRGKLDTVGLRSARNLFTDGQFPLAAAPEGATNGHSEIVSSVEPGIVQLGFWCAEDLAKAGRTEQVFILPIGIQYHYSSTTWKALEKLLGELEQDAGITAEVPEADLTWIQTHTALTDRYHAILYRRLIQLAEHLLTLMEGFYSKFYHQEFAAAQNESVSPDAVRADASGSLPQNHHIAQRLHRLLNAALAVAENYFGIQPRGDFNERCRRLEQAGWDRIYREDLKQIEALPPVERGLADRIAEEADLRLWHMRLVESFVSVTGQYVIEKPTVERFAETLLLMWDMVMRLKGNSPFPRPKLGAQNVQMIIGEPLSVSDRWQDYKANRRQTVAQLTQEVQHTFERMIM